MVNLFMGSITTNNNNTKRLHNDNTKSLRTPALDYALTDIAKGENAEGCS